MQGRYFFTVFTAVNLVLVIWQRMLFRPHRWPLALDVGPAPCSLAAWVELPPGSQHHLRAQSQMRATVLPRSIFCFILSKLIAIEAWAGAQRVAINSMCLILTILVFLIKTNWIYRSCVCGCIFKWHLSGRAAGGQFNPSAHSFLPRWSKPAAEAENPVFPQAQQRAQLLAPSRAVTWPDPTLT